MLFFNVTRPAGDNINAILITSFPRWENTSIKMAILNPSPAWKQPKQRQNIKLFSKS